MPLNTPTKILSNIFSTLRTLTVMGPHTYEWIISKNSLYFYIFLNDLSVIDPLDTRFTNAKICFFNFASKPISTHSEHSAFIIVSKT